MRSHLFRKTRLFSLLLSLSLLLLAFNNDSKKLLRVVPVDVDYFTTDRLGNAYVVDGDQLIKLGKDGVVQKTYSNKLLGVITSVDATDPFNLILFYRDFAQVLILDNMLSESAGPIALEDLGLEQSILCSSSHNRAIWIYDQTMFKLIRIDKDFKIAEESGNLNQLLGIEPDPNFLLQINNRVYLNDPEIGIMVFDVYGGYIKTIPVKGLKQFQVVDENLYYFQDSCLVKYKLQTVQSSSECFQSAVIKTVRIEKDRLYFLKPGTIEFYALL